MEKLLSFEFIILCLGVYAVMFVFKTLMEFISKKINMTSNSFYQDVVLPLLPLGVGVIAADIQHNDKLLGLAAGLLSGLIYRVVKSFLHKKE